MRARTPRTPVTEVATVPTSPETDCIGRTNHVRVDTTAVPAFPPRTLVDLFCGAGGIGLGFERAGFRSVFAVEMDEDAAATYQLNFPSCDLVLGDIRDLSDAEVLSRAGGVVIDVLAAGWPCQGLSSAGKRDPHDPRNLLYREAVRFARLLRPHFVVLENVPQLVNAENLWLLDDLLSSLANAGYPDASVMVLDAADHAVPQHRLRAITIANPHGWPNPYPLPLAGPHLTVRDAIGGLRDRPHDRWSGHDRARHSADTVAELARIRAGGSGYERSRQARRLLDPDAPAPTVTYCNGNGFVHYAEDRIITPLEYARLQGFPDDHLFEGGKGSIGRQICNAVPPPLAREIGLALRSVLDRGLTGAARVRPTFGRSRPRPIAGVSDGPNALRAATTLDAAGGCGPGATYLRRFGTEAHRRRSQPNTR